MSNTDFKYYWIVDIFYGYDPVEKRYHVFDGYDDYRDYFNELCL